MTSQQDDSDRLELMTVDEAADYLGVPRRTLYTWRYQSTGPPAFRIGRYLRYDRAAVDRWVRESCASDPDAT